MLNSDDDFGIRRQVCVTVSLCGCSEVERSYRASDLSVDSLVNDGMNRETPLKIR